MDSSVVEKGFETWSTPQERVTALVVAGIPEASIAGAVGVGIGTVKHWHEGKTSELKGRSFERLDNLRLAMKIIIDNGVDPDYAAAWVQSPIGDNPKNVPIAHINRDPEMVLGGIRKIFGPMEDQEEAEKQSLTSFGEVFSGLRSKRHISMSEFGLSPSHIHGIERKGTLPNRERLEVIKSHFREVAVEQGSKDGENEAKQLETAWLEDHFVRLGIDPTIAPTIAQVVIMEPDQQKTIAQAINSVENTT